MPVATTRMEDTGVSFHVQNPSRFTSLHVEILSCILMHIEGSDIPAVMQTCKALWSVIMTRQFWYHRIDRLCKEHLVSSPEEELEEYTIAELKQWSLRRIWARCTLPTQLQLRSWQDTEPPFTPNNMELIPGGRWLLLPPSHRDLHVCFFDLDNNNLEQYLLFDPGRVDSEFSDCPGVLGNYTWIDHKAPRLSFRCAICLLDGGGNGLQSSRVQIYQVNLIGHGADATLVAQIIATFRTPQRDAVLSCTFNDRHFVQARDCGSHGEIMEIYDYRQVLGCLDYPLIECHTAFPLGENFLDMEFINEGVLIVFYWAPTLHIINIESPTSIVSLHTINSCPGWLSCSKTCWTPGASIITWIDAPIRERNYKVITIHGLVIPHDSTLDPWPIELGRFRQKYRASLRLGVFISMTCNRTDNISRIRHEWDLTLQNSNPAHVTVLEHGVDEPQKLVAFDEDTGRSVHFGGGKMNVVDIVMAG